jgi:hypothetical protein
MANFIGMTTSSDAKFNNKEALQKYLEGFHFSEVQPGVGEHTFGLWGWETLEVNPQPICRGCDKPGCDDEEVNYEDDLIEEFFDGLRHFIADGETLTVQQIGYEKLRFPFFAHQVKVTREKVEWSRFSY